MLQGYDGLGRGQKAELEAGIGVFDFGVLLASGGHLHIALVQACGIGTEYLTGQVGVGLFEALSNVALGGRGPGHY